MAVGVFNINTSNLKALYHLEDVNDSSGNAKNLTNHGSVTFTGAKFGNGANLGSSNSTKNLQIADNLGVAGNGSVTISLWVKLLAQIASGTWRLAGLNSQTGADRYLDLDYDFNGGTIRFNFDAAGGVASFTKTLDTTLFHHLVITRDSTNVIGYLDAVKVAQAAIGSGTAGSNGFVIGGNLLNENNDASILVDELAVISAAWSIKQVQDYYAWSVGRRTSTH